MRATVVVVVVLASCGGPLAPGEMRCTTTDVYGTAFTNCKTGQAPPPQQPRAQQAQQPAVFWCTTRASDEFGYCTQQPGECENIRARGVGGCDGSPGSCPGFSPCAYQGYAICATSGCFVNPASCARAERLGRRDAAACVLRR